MTRRETKAMVALVCGETELASWRVVGSGTPDLAVAEALARMQLEARRLGWSIRLRDPSTELLELLDLVGLTALAGRAGTGTDAGLRQVGRQAEARKQAGVDEVVVPDNPVA